MITKLSFKELQRYIAQHHMHEVVFSYVDAKTVSVTTQVKVMIFKKSVGLNLSVVRVEGSNITVSYGNGLGKDIIVMGVLSFLKNTLPRYQEVIDHDANTVTIHLDKLKNVERFLEYVTLDDICFDSDGMIIDATLK